MVVLDDPAQDPIHLFLDWMREAIDARVLILKGVDARGFAFASAASSRKGRQLAAGPRQDRVLAGLNPRHQRLIREL